MRDAASGELAPDLQAVLSLNETAPPIVESHATHDEDSDEDEFDDAEFMATHGVRAVEMIAHEIETKERLLRDLEHRAELERAELAKLREVSASLTEVHVRRRTLDRGHAPPRSRRSARGNRPRVGVAGIAPERGLEQGSDSLKSARPSSASRG